MAIVLGNPFLNITFPITQYFGENPWSYTQFGVAGHNGIDFGCPEGTPIYSVYPGTVTKIGYDPQGYGNYVRVTTDFGRVIYAHLRETVVRVNDKVTMGQIIGRSGNTGYSSGPHLHLEVRKNGEEGNGYNGAVDPLLYMTGMPIPDVIEPIPVPIEDTIIGSEAVVMVDSLNIRNGVVTTYDGSNVIGQLYGGSKIKILSTVESSTGIKWAKFVGYCCIANEDGIYLN
jgi:hypothetical protein